MFIQEYISERKNNNNQHKSQQNYMDSNCEKNLHKAQHSMA